MAFGRRLSHRIYADGFAQPFGLLPFASTGAATRSRRKVRHNMNGYYIKLGDTIRIAFGTFNLTTGVATNADSTPVVLIVDNGSAIGYSPVVTNLATGLYEVAIVASTGNGFAVGHSYTVVVSWAVASASVGDGIGAFKVSTRQVDDVMYPGYAIYGTITHEQLQRLIADAVSGQTGGFGTSSITIKSQDGTKTRATITIGSGGRTAVTIGDLT